MKHNIFIERHTEAQRKQNHSNEEVRYEIFVGDHPLQELILRCLLFLCILQCEIVIDKSSQTVSFPIILKSASMVVKEFHFVSQISVS